MTQDACNGSAIMLDTVIHSFTVNYSSFIGCLPGMPSVGDTAVNKTASGCEELLIPERRPANKEAEMARNAETGEPDLASSTSSQVLIRGPGVSSLRLPLCFILAILTHVSLPHLGVL